jgi:hypothetical protein
MSLRKLSTLFAVANQFNPSVGTLTSVVVSVTVNMVAEVDVYNVNGPSEMFTNATTSVPVSLSGPASLSVGATVTTTPISGTVIGTQGNPSLGYGLYTQSGLTATASNSVTLSTMAALAPYIGVGMANLPFSLVASPGVYSGTGPAGVAFGGSASVGATITVTYNYVPVPEPASIALLGLGSIAGLVGRRVLRRRQS